MISMPFDSKTMRLAIKSTSFVGVKYPGYRGSPVMAQNSRYDRFPPTGNGWGNFVTNPGQGLDIRTNMPVSFLQRISITNPKASGGNGLRHLEQRDVATGAHACQTAYTRVLNPSHHRLNAMMALAEDMHALVKMIYSM
jgi:hypothetical protein